MEEWVEKYSNILGVNGRIGKDIPKGGKGSKRWSKPVAKATRARNCECITKGGICYMSIGDADDIAGKLNVQSSKNKCIYQETLMWIWKNIDRPTSHRDILFTLWIRVMYRRTI